MEHSQELSTLAAATNMVWRKSTTSASGSDSCVEVARLRELVLVRPVHLRDTGSGADHDDHFEARIAADHVRATVRRGFQSGRREPPAAGLSWRIRP